jgi:formate dehydrogenase subunit gamma
MDRDAWNAQKAAAIVSELADRDGALLPILHALARAFGHVPDAAVPMIAGALNISRAEVHGVLTFYHDFKRVPPPPVSLKLCRAEACQARGGEALAEHAQAVHGARSDLAIEPVYCLGLCASGPAALLDGRPHARLSAERLDRLLGETPA